MIKILSAIAVFGMSSILHAENWVFVPSKENKCNIKVYYNSSALKNKNLIEKWDVGQSSDCETTKDQEYLIFESKLDCNKNQITSISRTIYFKDGSKKKYKDKDLHKYEPQGTPKLLLNEACSVINNKH